VPVPEAVTICGLPDASSVKVTVPDVAPVMVGLNVTVTLHLAPGATVEPPALDIVKGPDTVIDRPCTVETDDGLVS